MSKNGKLVSDSGDAYALLKVITDAAQSGELKPWSPKVVELLNSYGVVDRKQGVKAEITVSFPTSTHNRSMAVGVRYLKPDSSWTEDLFLFEENVGLTKFYKGTQETILPEYNGTHHGMPTVALQESIPDIKQEISELKRQLQTNDIFNTIDMSLVVTPNEHHQEINSIDQNFQDAVRSMMAHANGVPVSHISINIQPKFNKRRVAQMNSWSKSESIYNEKLNQIGELYKKDSEEYEDSIDRLNRIFGK